jgi:hypothetical protein
MGSLNWPSNISESLLSDFGLQLVLPSPAPPKLADEAPVLGVRPPPVKTGTKGSHLSYSNLGDSADVLHLLITGGSMPLRASIPLQGV